MSSDIHELVAAYALDALDDDERARFERHLAVCERCSVELAELQETAAVLAFATEGPEPPPELRERILDAAGAESGGAQVIPLSRRRWALPAVAAVAAVAACAAIGLGIWSASLSRSLDQEREAKSAYEKTARLLAAKVTAMQLQGADGSLLVSADGRAAIVVCGLSRAPSSKTYEAWVIDGDTPRPAGLFRGGGACSPVVLSRPVGPNSLVAVTLERKEGVEAPTGDILFKAAPA